MIINPQTKIAELIKFNEQSIDAIAAISKPLEKLKNPILRKILASRVTIAEAAKMGNSTLEDFKRALIPLGFIFSGAGMPVETVESPPSWLAGADKNKINIFDVRPIIDNGSDPLKEILHQFKEVAPGSILCVINNFIPTPLIHLLKREKAEDSFVKTISDNEYHTYFLKGKPDKESLNRIGNSQVIMDDEGSFNKVCAQFGSEVTKVIDVRALEMPLPMQTILHELEMLPASHALYVHHKRVPVYLLEELAHKNYHVHILNIAEGNVKMLLFQ